MRKKQLLRILILVFVLGIGFYSCKKKDSYVGSSTINPDALLNATIVDTFSFNTYSIWEDSVITSTSSVALLGNYVDPVFGPVNSSFFTQLRLPSTSPNFGDLNSIVLDSFVLGLKYDGVYGTLEDQTFEVYELSDTLDVETFYYSFSSNVDEIYLKESVFLQCSKFLSNREKCKQLNNQVKTLLDKY